MNVLYLTMNPNRASTTAPTEGWFRVLRPEGLRPVLVSHEVGAFHAWAVREGIPAYNVALPEPNKWKPWRFLHSLWSLRRLVKRHGVQLIHCNEQNIYPIGQYLGRLCGLPVVVSVHFTMARGFCRWAFGGARRPARVFFVSASNRDACRAGMEGVSPESEWRVLVNGLDLAHFRPDPVPRAEFRSRHGLDGCFVLGVACALRGRKQLEHLFEATARLAVPRLRVVVAGGPVPGEPEGYADGLLRLGRDKLGDRLVHVGHLTELRPFYNGLDLFVNTSQEEACSISVLELWPGGGEIVAQDRADRRSEALGRWLDDPARLVQAREGARRRAEEAYDIRTISGQLWAEYQDVVRGGGLRRKGA